MVAVPGDLTTIALVKAYLPITDTGADVLLQSLVTGASDFFRQITCRNVLFVSDPLNPITETRDGRNRFRMATRENPISAVASVTINTISIPVSTDPLTSGFAFDADSIFLRSGYSIRSDYSFVEGFGNVTFVYTAGYADAGSQHSAIQDAVTILVAQKFKRRPHLDKVSEALGGQITESFSQKDIPPEVQTVINRFTRAPVYG